MSTTDHRAGLQQEAGAPGVVIIGGREVVIERPTGLKASRALAIIRSISTAANGLAGTVTAFRADYREQHVRTLDRVQAQLEFPPRPLTRTGPDGRAEFVFDAEGEVRLMPSPVALLSEEDWASAGGVYRIPEEPGWDVIALHLFEDALEAAEQHVYRLVALFTISNEELKRYRRENVLDERLTERADELLEDGYLDELMELAVAIGETVDQHFRRKADALGGRLGKFLALVGIKWTPNEPTSTPDSPSETKPSSPKPNSSTGTPASTPDGPQTSSSTPPSSSSPNSEPSPSASAESKPSETPSPKSTAE